MARRPTWRDYIRKMRIMHVEQFMSDVADMARRCDKAVLDLLPKLQAHMAPADYQERKAIIEDLLARVETRNGARRDEQG